MDWSDGLLFLELIASLFHKSFQLGRGVVVSVLLLEIQQDLESCDPWFGTVCVFLQNFVKHIIG